MVLKKIEGKGRKIIKLLRNEFLAQAIFSIFFFFPLYILRIQMEHMDNLKSILKCRAMTSFIVLFSFAGCDKSLKWWKSFWCWSLTPSDVVCFALWEGKPCSTDAAFQQVGIPVCKIQAWGNITKLAFCWLVGLSLRGALFLVAPPFLLEASLGVHCILSVYFGVPCWLFFCLKYSFALIIKKKKKKRPN